MKMNSKKGLSPVIATVLLVMLAVVLAAIVFLWARSFISEKVTKNGEVIENSCGLVQFSAAVENGNVVVENTANVPLYGVNIKRVSGGEISDLGNPFTEAGNPEDNILPGDTKQAGITAYENGATYRITPVLLGINDKGERKAYTCADSTSIDVQAS